MVGKISQLIERIHDEIKITKVIDVKQLKAENSSDPKDIIITDNENYQTLELNGIYEGYFEKTLIIDDVKNNTEGSITYINRSYLITSIGTVVDDFIKLKNPENNFIPISIKKIRNEINYPCEIFVRLSKKKHIKILNKENDFPKEVLEKLILKNVQFLYVKSEDINIFNNMSFERNNEQISDGVSSEIGGVESLHNYIMDLGFDPKIVDMTKNIQKSIENKFTHKFMKKLFSRFNDMEGSFLYNHSYLTSVIALTTGKKFTWMNMANREKIYLGCILHDLGYKHKENALRESFTKDQIDDLSSEEQSDILDHPTKFAKHLAQISNIHQDVIKIVRDHHGVHGELSYPKPIYPAEVNLIFALFVLSHELSLGLYEISFNEDKIPALLEEVCERFNKGNYKKIIPEFRHAIDEIFFTEKAA
jgi:putative nucleotidyltransferase with HDIG domain